MLTREFDSDWRVARLMPASFSILMQNLCDVLRLLTLFFHLDRRVSVAHRRLLTEKYVDEQLLSCLGEMKQYQMAENAVIPSTQA